jgi:hypothetical protein
MSSKERYVGIDNDEHGGMTNIGTLIRDAWVFGILAEDETCEGWTAGQFDALYDKVSAAWQPYGHLASHLPAELMEKHARIYGHAVERARSLGWDPELEEDSD